MIDDWELKYLKKSFNLLRWFEKLEKFEKNFSAEWKVFKYVCRICLRKEFLKKSKK